MRSNKKMTGLPAFPLLFLLLGFIILAGVLYLTGRSHFTKQKIYERNWGLSLPDSMKCLHDSHSPPAFHGEGIRHTVFQLEPEQMTIPLKAGRNPETESFCASVCQDLETDTDYLPDFEKRYGWTIFEKSHDTLVIVYFPDLKQLHFFQEIF